MRDAKDEMAWDKMSVLLSMLYNANNKKKRKPKDFHPYKTHGGLTEAKHVTLEDFKQFCKRGGRGKK